MALDEDAFSWQLSERNLTKIGKGLKSNATSNIAGFL